MPEEFIAIQIVAVCTANTLDEREAMEKEIIRALGCDNTEADCPMVMYASTVVDNIDDAFTWLE
jgi:hypothetical protein